MLHPQLLCECPLEACDHCAGARQPTLDDLLHVFHRIGSDGPGKGARQGALGCFGVGLEERRSPEHGSAGSRGR